MKKYTPLDGLRWSRNSDSALNNMPQTDVLGRAGGHGHRRQFHRQRVTEVKAVLTLSPKLRNWSGSVMR